MSTPSGDEFLEELCTHLLPDERKRVIAVWKDISDGGDPSLFSKLLTLNFAGDSRVLAHVDKRFESLRDTICSFKEEQVELTSNRDLQRQRELPQVILDILPQVRDLLQLEEIASSAARQANSIEEMRLDIKAVRRARVTGLSLLLFLGAFIGVGLTAAIFWKPYRDGQRFSRWIADVEQSGVGLVPSETTSASLLTIQAERGNLAWTAQRDATGKIFGLRVEILKGGAE